MKTLIKILAVLAIVLFIAYLIVVNLPQANIKGKDAVETISAVELYDAYSKNEKQANRIYTGKVVQIAGEIDEIYSDENDAPVVVLRSPVGDLVSVVTLEPSEKQKIASHKEGDQLTVKALCSGKLMEVTLNKGLIID
jgi:type II secretory pathway pseudopilin PulG